MDSVQLNFRRACGWLAIVLSCLALWLSCSGEAHAQDGAECTVSYETTPCNRAEAYAYCAARAQKAVDDALATNPPAGANVGEWRCNENGREYNAKYSFWGTWPSAGAPNGFKWKEENECPAGSNWDDIAKECNATCASGEWNNPDNPAECLSPQKCLARNAEPGYMGVGETVRVDNSNCVAGCSFKATATASTPVVTVGLPGGGSLTRGIYEYTGDACGVSQNVLSEDDAKKKTDQECVPSADGQTFCVKANGDLCYSLLSMDRLVCWGPGETGVKTDKNVLQKRQPGTPEPDPSVELPNGDTANKHGESVVNNSEVTNNFGNTTTITTTTTNYTTVSGADAGDEDQGENTTCEEGEECDKEEGGTGSASADCSAPPACSSTDSIGCAMLRQSWENHCAWFKPYEGPDPTDFSSEPPIEAGSGLFEDGPDPGDVFGTLPSGGWAGRGTCPIDFSFTVRGTTHDLDASQLCDLLDALAALVILSASILAGHILGGGYK